MALGLKGLVGLLLLPLTLLFRTWDTLIDTIGILINYFTRLDWLNARFKRLKTDTYKLNIVGLPRPAYVTRDPAVLQLVLKDDFDNFEKGEEFRVRFEEMLGEGIFNIDGASKCGGGRVIHLESLHPPLSDGA